MKKSALLLGGVSSIIQGMEPSINIVPRWRRRKEKEKGEDDPWIPSVGGACFCEVCTQLQSRKPKSRRRLLMNRQQTRLSLSLSLSLSVSVSLAHSKTVFPWIQGTTAFSWSAAWLPPYQRDQCMVEHKKIIALFKPLPIRAQREIWSGVQLIRLRESEKLERILECNWS